MLTDAAAIGLTLLGLRLAARPAGGALTFGLRRVEILSAQANGVTLLVLAAFIAYEGVHRLVDPPHVKGALVLVRALTAGMTSPVIGVLGNHDYAGGKPEEMRQILVDGGVTVLDGEATELHGVGFAGVKGFAGGFGRGALGPWGEHAIKAFVQEAVDEALKLESALARLRTQKRIALLHYSPIRATVEGEPPEIFAYLGSSRLEEPINRFRVSAVFHGHAHRGAPEGRTSTGVPVHNVSIPLLIRTNPNRPPFLIVEMPLDDAETAAPPAEPRGEPLVKSA